MEHVDELIAGYALHALDAEDQRAVVAHIELCERCRARVREYEGVAAALAHAAPPAEPPPELRGRLLGAIAPEVVATEPAAPSAPEPSRQRWSWWPRASAVAVPALAALAVALAIWNVSLRNDLHDRNVRSVAPIAHVGSVVSYQGGRVGLLGHVRPAPAGHVYEAWVIPPGQKPLAAGTFPGGRIALTLTRPAAPGDRIVVTLEPGQGGATPRGPAVGQATLA